MTGAQKHLKIALDHAKIAVKCLQKYYFVQFGLQYVRIWRTAAAEPGRPRGIYGSGRRWRVTSPNSPKNKKDLLIGKSQKFSAKTKKRLQKAFSKKSQKHKKRNADLSAPLKPITSLRWLPESYCRRPKPTAHQVKSARSKRKFREKCSINFAKANNVNYRLTNKASFIIILCVRE